MQIERYYLGGLAHASYGRQMSCEQFVDLLTTHRPSRPAWFRDEVKRNRLGATSIGELTERRGPNPAEVSALQAEAGFVLDTRPAIQFRDGHVPGVTGALDKSRRIAEGVPVQTGRASDAEFATRFRTRQHSQTFPDVRELSEREGCSMPSSACMVPSLLQAGGFKNVMDLKGGYDAWVRKATASHAD